MRLASERDHSLCARDTLEAKVLMMMPLKGGLDFLGGAFPDNF